MPPLSIKPVEDAGLALSPRVAHQLRRQVWASHLPTPLQQHWRTGGRLKFIIAFQESGRSGLRQQHRFFFMATIYATEICVPRSPSTVSEKSQVTSCKSGAGSQEWFSKKVQISPSSLKGICRIVHFPLKTNNRSL